MDISNRTTGNNNNNKINEIIHQALISNILNMYHNSIRSVRNPNRIFINFDVDQDTSSDRRTRINSVFYSSPTFNAINEEHTYNVDHDDLSSSILLDVVTQFGSPGSDSGWMEKIKAKRKQQLKKISYKKIKENDPITQENCSICLDNFVCGEYKRKLNCNHSFHKKCIDRWFKKDHTECPMCRTDVFGTL